LGGVRCAQEHTAQSALPDLAVWKRREPGSIADPLFADNANDYEIGVVVECRHNPGGGGLVIAAHPLSATSNRSRFFAQDSNLPCHVLGQRRDPESPRPRFAPDVKNSQQKNVLVAAGYFDISSLIKSCTCRSFGPDIRTLVYHGSGKLITGVRFSSAVRRDIEHVDPRLRTGPTEVIGERKVDVYSAKQE